jgi:hypothetical protein
MSLLAQIAIFLAAAVLGDLVEEADTEQAEGTSAGTGT